MDWPHLAQELPSKTRYSKIDRRKNKRDGNTRKRRKQLLDDLKKQRGYWKLEEEALELAMEETMDLS